MVLFGYQRLAYLFDAIVRESLPQDELAKRFSVSTRTIRTDISLLNDVLARYGANIQYDRGIGYQLLIKDPALYATLPLKRQQVKNIPRTTKERIYELTLLFLTSNHPIKLDDLAASWYISLGALQNDMVELRENLIKYQLKFETKPRLGLSLIGDEISVRNCMTDIIWQLTCKEDDRLISQFNQKILQNIPLDYLQKLLQTNFHRFDIKMNEAHQRYLGLNCAISIFRITQGYELIQNSQLNELEELEELEEYQSNYTEILPLEIDAGVKNAAREISKGMSLFLGDEMPAAEIAYLEIQIAARKIPDLEVILIEDDQNSKIVQEILNYLNDTYKYDVRHDEKLKLSLLTHITAMMTRLHYQINTSNPLLSDIKQYYPFAYDVTLSAISCITHPLFSRINEDEIGYLAMHIAVGLERHYNTAYQSPTALLVCDSGNGTLLMMEEKIKREFPQLILKPTTELSLYEKMDTIQEDFVITTIRLSEKNKPIVKVSPFPTDYQIEQIAKFVMVERTKSYILSHFFDAEHFMIIEDQITQAALFKQVCHRLETEGHVTGDFHASVCEREAIVSTMLNENIAVPHALGLLAKKTVIVTILAPNGIKWYSEDQAGATLKSQTKDVAQVIFLLAICEEDYEAIMAMYDLFITFVREKATKRLLASQNFNEFLMIAKDSLGRLA